MTTEEKLTLRSDLKQEVLDECFVIGERHVNQINREAMAWQHEERPHTVRNHLSPRYDKSQPHSQRSIRAKSTA